MSETTEEFIKRFDKEWSEGMQKQKEVLKALLAFERFICIQVDTRLPKNNINITISSDLFNEFSK